MDVCNRESIFDELNNFEKRKAQETTPILDEYLARIARTGDPIFPWLKLKPLFRHKLDRAITDFNETYPARDLPQSANVEKFDFEEMHVKLMKAVDEFSGTPFTIQRLCELVISPYKQYKRADKFMRALEKDLLVVSTIEPLIYRNKNDSETNSLVNGVYESNSSLNGTPKDVHHSSSSNEGTSSAHDDNSKELGDSVHGSSPQQNVQVDSASDPAVEAASTDGVVLPQSDGPEMVQRESDLSGISLSEGTANGGADASQRFSPELSTSVMAEVSSSEASSPPPSNVSSVQPVDANHITGRSKDRSESCEEEFLQDGCSSTEVVGRQGVSGRPESPSTDAPEKQMTNSVIESGPECDQSAERRMPSEPSSDSDIVECAALSTSQEAAVVTDMDTEDSAATESATSSCEADFSSPNAVVGGDVCSYDMAAAAATTTSTTTTTTIAEVEKMEQD